MIIEGIRNLLGEDLAKQVEAALKGKGKDGKDVDLVIGNDGTFVPAEKYNGANSGKASAENALKAAAEALKAVGGSGDPAKIADDVKVAKEKFDTLQTTHAAELAKISKRSALQMALNGKVYDPSDTSGNGRWIPASGPRSGSPPRRRSRTRSRPAEQPTTRA